MQMKEIKGAILIGILFCTFISWIPNHGASYFQWVPLPDAGCWGVGFLAHGHCMCVPPCPCCYPAAAPQ
jgi:hypothetical protein